MTTKQIDNSIQRIKASVADGSYTAALGELEALAEALQAPWEAKREIARLRDNFNLMKRFALDGYADPSRADMLAETAAGISLQATLLLRRHESVDNPSVYYSTLRYENMQTLDTIASLIARYDDLVARYSLSRYSGSVPQKSGGVTRRELEDAENRIFARLWTTFPLSASDVEATVGALSSEAFPASSKHLILNAVLLGGLQQYDEARLTLLTDLYATATDRRLGIQSLCALMLLLWRWRTESFGSELRNRLKLLLDAREAVSDVRMVFLQFIRTLDTARITREVNEELIPKMRNLSPDLKKLSELQEMTLDSLDENPQWSELLRDSGIEEQLKRLNDMQLEGADVMMSTFSHLKNFPFFNDVVNWFRPFDPDFSMLNEGSHAGASQLIEMLGQAAFLCDSDKYSMAFSFGNLPPQMLDMVRSQLSAQNINLAEAASQATGADESRQTANLYMQNLYRFFNLFRRKGDFYNPFSEKLSLFEVDELRPALNDSETIATIAEFYLRHGYYDDALRAYSLLPEEELFLADEILQKVGYCRQKLGDYEGAIDAYSKSELIDGRNRWTLRRLAYCHKALGHAREALGYFNRLLEQLPDDLQLTLNAGHCLMELGNYSEAMNRYFKVEFLDENTTKTHRPIAWCALLAGDMDRARLYFAKVMENNPVAADYVNQGYFLMADSQPRAAAESFTKALDLLGRDFHRLREIIDSDSRYLVNLHLDPMVMTLVLDEVQASLWN